MAVSVWLSGVCKYLASEVVSIMLERCFERI